MSACMGMCVQRGVADDCILASMAMSDMSRDFLAHPFPLVALHAWWRRTARGKATRGSKAMAHCHAPVLRAWCASTSAYTCRCPCGLSPRFRGFLCVIDVASPLSGIDALLRFARSKASDALPCLLTLCVRVQRQIAFGGVWEDERDGFSSIQPMLHVSAGSCLPHCPLALARAFCAPPARSLVCTRHSYPRLSTCIAPFQCWRTRCSILVF